MVVTGGIGVLVVIAFVAAVAFGREHEVAPGDRIALIEAKGPAKLSVLVGRCDDERVDAVEIRRPDGDVLWRIESPNGSIARRFVVGADPPPFGFEAVTPLGSTLAGRLVAEAEVDGVADRELFDTAALDQERAPSAPCDGNDIGLVSILFVVGALGVVAAYGVMVRRYLGGR